MNKYQEALNELASYYDYDDYPKILQELVDKATPKKPLEIIFNNFGMGERIGRCPNCKILVNQFQSHCECNQKLDWSKDD